jgi:tetratricopeptide (TPR) repeat protein
MDGEYQKSLDAAKAPVPHTRSEALVVMPILILMRFARWDDLLAFAGPDRKLTGVVFFWHFARGCAFASKGRLKEAGEERRALEVVISDLPPGRAFGMFLADWGTLHTLAAASLDARMAAARGDTNTAIGDWRRAVAVQDELKFDDVPDWYYPVRESLGAALLRSGSAQEAEQVFREDLRRNPRNPRSLFGLCKALEAQKKTYEVGWVRRSFEVAWRGKEPPRIEDF